MSKILPEHAQAAFLGFALGDAYGRELEFLSGHAVRSHRIRVDKALHTSDETHMAMYTAQAIINHPNFNVDTFGHALAEALVDWSQDPRTTKTSPSKHCMQAVRNYRQQREWRRSGITHIDGSGAIMRVLPIAIAYQSPRMEQAAEISALITHSHPNAIASAVSCARLLRTALEERVLTANHVLSEALLIEEEYPNASTVPAALRAAVLQSNRKELDWLDERGIPDGDGGWKAPSALGLALTAVLHFSSDTRLAIDKAARINGDSDAVAALTGMFLGAANGLDSLPFDWIQSLSDSHQIMAFANQLTQQKTPAHWLLEKCQALEQKGARFAVESSDFLIMVPQTSTNGILTLRPIAEELGVPLEVENGAVILRMPKTQAPPSFVSKYQQDEDPIKPTPTPKKSWEAEVIDEHTEEIWDAEILEEPMPSFQQPTQTIPTTNNPKSEFHTSEYRTSITDPIMIDQITELGLRGSLGITFAPGKHATSAFGAPWRRDLQIDLDRMVAIYRLDTLFSLIEDTELEKFNITHLVEEANKRNITVYRSPIVDTKAPKMTQAIQMVQIAIPLLQSGKNIAFHCRGGLGRAGTMSACTLVALGFHPKDAIKKVRAHRKHAVENIYQEQFIFDFDRQWRLGN